MSNVAEQGRTCIITLPTGRKVEIRETNGDDDATLSRMGDASTGENVSNFLANIIIGPEKILAKDIAEWPLNDKYVLLFKQRIFNMGSELKFTHTDPLDKKKQEVEYTEDLSTIDGELSDKDYTPGPNQIFRYPNGDKRLLEFIISTKKKLRYKIMNGITEDVLGSIAQEDLNRNSPLIARDIEWFNKTKWEKLFSFRHFTSKEMAEIRHHIGVNDRLFDPTVSFTNPNTQRLINLPLMSIGTFYFPEGTI